MEKLDIEMNRENSTLLNTLLKKLKTKQITLSEYFTECAYWFMTDIFDTIKWKPRPTKPSDVISFERLNYNQKERLSDDYFYDNWRIVEYYESVYKILHINIGNLQNMIKVYQNIPEGDVLNRDKLKKKIDFFSNKIEWRRDKEWFKLRLEKEG